MELRVAAAEGRYEDEGWRIRKDGSRFWANVVITALRNDAGELVGFGKVTRDLTERRESELRKIEDARRMADIEASNRTKAEFLTAMSHELRTPLNAIGGYTELLSIGVRGPITEAQRADLERIRRSQQHLLGIINDLLNFSRIEAGQITYESAPVRLEDVVNGVLPMIEPQAAQKELALTHECGPRETIAVADRARIEQIMINLLSNAVKFTPPGGRIAVTCFTRDGDACIAVADTGVGIPEDKLESVFEPFVQLGRTLTTSHEGTGLGLAISRDLARAMRGDLRVESAVGKGSTFTLSLPKG
jgi:signal transduction histidine kinase